MQNGSNAGDMVGAIQKNRPQGVEIGDDGTKIFIIKIILLAFKNFIIA
jgi:hypothetical protein